MTWIFNKERMDIQQEKIDMPSNGYETFTRVENLLMLKPHSQKLT